MSLPSTAIDKKLNSLLEEAYIIADKSKLYGIRPKVFKSHEAGFRNDDNNFGDYVRYSLNPSAYSQWITNAATTLREHGLQDAKFRVKVNEFDPSRESNLPAQEFIRAIHELEKIAHDKKYQESYVSKLHIPTAHFRDNTLTQGSISHKFNTQYASLISFLWQYREIQNSAGVTTKAPDPRTYSMIESKTGIKHELYANIAKALRKLERDKGIHIQLKYPRGTKHAHLLIRQD